MGVGRDWDAWNDIALPTDKLNFWDEPYAELYDWYPWMRRFYTSWEIEHNCLPVRGTIDMIVFEMDGWVGGW